MKLEEQKTDLALELYRIGAFKFGDFIYKSGTKGPIYLDLRLLISYPDIMKKVAKIYAYLLSDLNYDRLAGVAYAALPITSAISLEINKPWIFMRKEGLKKQYGLQKSLEGEFKPGEIAVMIEDLVNKATSLNEAISAMEKHGLKIKDTVVLIDYEKGGRQTLEQFGYRLHAFMTTKELVEIFHNQGKIDDTMHQRCLDFLNA